MQHDVLVHVARGLSLGPPRRERWFAIKGGMALAAAYGLTRPSDDLDIDVAQKIDAVARIGRTLEHRKDLQVERLDVKQRGRGYVRLWFRHVDYPEPFRTKVDVNVRDGLLKPALDRDRIVTVDGLAVYDMPTLANLKLNPLVGEDCRVKAGDLYDAAWLTAAHPDAITLENKLRLHEWTGAFHGSVEEEWRQAFAQDKNLGSSRCSCDDVVLALMANLEADAELQSHLRSQQPAPAPGSAMRP